MSVEQAWLHIMGRLHDCVFCGLEKTEKIEVNKDFTEKIKIALQGAGIRYLEYKNRFVIFTTGLQLDKSFSDGQV